MAVVAAASRPVVAVAAVAAAGVEAVGADDAVVRAAAAAAAICAVTAAGAESWFAVALEGADRTVGAVAAQGIATLVVALVVASSTRACAVTRQFVVPWRAALAVAHHAQQRSGAQVAAEAVAPRKKRSKRRSVQPRLRCITTPARTHTYRTITNARPTHLQDPLCCQIPVVCPAPCTCSAAASGLVAGASQRQHTLSLSSGGREH